MNESRQDLSIQGLSFFGGGDYDEVSISGFASAKGAVCAGRLHIDGIARFGKRAEIGTCTISGIGAFRSELAVDKLEIDGVCRIGGNLQARTLTANGRVRIAGDVACDHLSSSGSWKCRGNVSAADCQIDGAIRIDGVLSASTVEFSPDVSSRVRELVADRITIEPDSLDRNTLWKIVSRILGIRPIVHVRLIEGDDVDIDAVHASFVCGKRVKIGPRCSVDTVEYTKSLTVHPTATVRQVRNVSE